MSPSTKRASGKRLSFVPVDEIIEYGYLMTQVQEFASDVTTDVARPADDEYTHSASISRASGNEKADPGRSASCRRTELNC